LNVSFAELDVGIRGRLVNSLFARQLAKAAKPCGGIDIELLGQLVSGAYHYSCAF
jgi:hypothetical protein